MLYSIILCIVLYNMLCRGVIYRGVTDTRTFTKQICIIIFIKQNCIVNNYIKHKYLIASV